jgi:toxin ParE1/3/4
MAGFNLSARARQDLRDIGAYIARDNPLAAGRLIENLERRLEMLGDYPLAGRSREEFGTGLRSIPFRRYSSFIWFVRTKSKLREFFTARAICAAH